MRFQVIQISRHLLSSAFEQGSAQQSFDRDAVEKLQTYDLAGIYSSIIPEASHHVSLPSPQLELLLVLLLYP